MDDGTIAHAGNVDTNVAIARVVAMYEKTGAPLPDILSVWTAFEMDHSNTETIFEPVANDVTGIGLETQFGGDGTFASIKPPLRAILLHNDVTQLARRAEYQLATTDGFAQYLFLLELTHMWGPAISVPSDGSDAGAQELIGFPFHWSFWMNAGVSAAGGNPWVDNGNGTFSVSGQTPRGIRYSMLDLYLMGLVPSSDVPPFAVLENAIAPAGTIDPLYDAPYAADSFPYFGAAALTVTASARALTIEDVIAANGARVPDAASSPKSWTLGVALAFATTPSAAYLAKETALFEPIAASMVGAFHDATGGRGTLVLVTASKRPGDAGVGVHEDAGADGTAPADAASARAAPPLAQARSGGCAAGSADTPSGLLGLTPLVAALTLVGVRRRSRRH